VGWGRGDWPLCPPPQPWREIDASGHLPVNKHMEDVHSATPALPLGTLFLII